MSFDWLIIPFLLLLFGCIAYLVMRRQRERNLRNLRVSRESIIRHRIDTDRAEDRSRDWE